MKLIERIIWIGKHMKEPCLVVRGKEFGEVAKAVAKQTEMDVDITRSFGPYPTGIAYLSCLWCAEKFKEIYPKFCYKCGQKIKY